MRQPRHLAIHPSLIAPDLTAHVERHLMWPFGTLVAIVLYAGFLQWWAWLVALVVGGAGYWGLVMLARIDPLWSRVYWRSLRYQSSYLAHTRTALRLRRRGEASQRVEGGMQYWFRTEFREPEGFERELNYERFVCDDPVVIQQRDWSFLRAWDLQGPDLRYASDAERERLSALVSQALRLYAADGWAVYVHHCCRERPGYLPRASFPDPTSALLDEEARRRYEAETTHYEHVMALAVTWKPPREWVEKYSHLFYEGMQRGQEGRQGLLREFLRVTEEMADVLRSVLVLAPMDRDGLCTYLHTCVTGDGYPLRAPDVQIPLNVAIADQDVIGGFEPQVGRLHLRVLTIEGFPPTSAPQGQEFLQELGIPFHACTRFVFHDHEKMQHTLDEKRRKHYQRRSRLRGVLAETLQGDAGHGINQGALYLANDAREALAEQEIGDAIYGVYTRTISVWHEDTAVVETYAKQVQQVLRQHGYSVRLETMNAMEALSGSFPGHTVQNLRSVLLHTLNLADLLPVTSVWSGQPMVTSPYFPPQSPALLLGTTTGKAPFFFSPYVGDVGHCLLLGPTGSGKTTLLAMLIASFLRYLGARVFAFDHKYGLYALCRAVGGWHYDVGGGEQVGLLPLAHIDDERERVWAAGWLEECLTLQGVAVTAAQRTELWDALGRLGSLPGNRRTLTDFCATVQDHQIREGLHHYTLSGGGGDLFDCHEASPLDHHVVVCELSHVMQRGDQDLIPAMRYFFHEVERRLDGRPTLITIDEAWMPLMHSRLGDKLEEWLRMFRDKNAMLVFASQSVADVLHSPHRDLLIEQCPTKLFAPNPEAETGASRQLYEAMGLSDQEIEALRWAPPKQCYLSHSPLGRALFTLSLGRAALSFVGVSGPAQGRAVKACADQHGPTWPAVWLRERGCVAEAAWWLEAYERRHGKEEPYVSHFTMPVRPQSPGNGLAGRQ